MVMNLQAKSLKATVILDAEAVSRIQIPNGMPKTGLRGILCSLVR